MKLSNYLFFVMGLTIARPLLAAVPYNELDELRRQTIVVKVAVEQPRSPRVQQCKTKVNPKSLSTKLSAAQANASAQWSQSTIGSQDLFDLEEKTQACMTRASCHVYDIFLKAVKVDPAIQTEVELLKSSLDKKLQSMSSNIYVKAWDTVPKPCDVLTQAIKK
ncbi:hypothetical protein [Bdellovibrio sp. HCB337]|uniref:hypothetical protein n=1 Tax=Bdellovibrio sp. HCB337 TaxID=3394358 RepID=UPI0039A6AEF0